MNLLTFAHRGEAQYFLEADNYKPVNFSIKGLFQSRNNYILLTGEGFDSVKRKLNPVLNQSEFRIDRIINLGIAGALDSNIQIDSIYSIRQVFGEGKSEAFYSDDNHAKVDCISALNRVQEKQYAEELSQIASIVDRELWMIASICNNYDLSFSSIKLISDHAGITTNLKKIMQETAKFSERLYDFYSNNLGF